MPAALLKTLVDKTIRIVIVEDQQLLAQALAQWVSRQVEYALVGCAADGERGMELCLRTNPGIVLVDIQLPGLDGLELGRRLLRHLPKTRVVAMSGLIDPYTIWRVRQSGVHGYIDKTQGLELLGQCIHAVAEGGTYFSLVFERVRRDWLMLPEAFYKVLSDREQRILRMVAMGQDDHVIGTQLGIADATVGSHRKHIRQKLELHNDRDLVAYARQWGLDRADTDPPPAASSATR